MSSPLFFEKIDPSAHSIRCGLCPHECVIAEGKSGLCRVRKNVEGKMELPFYGSISALNVDPMEKKPLYHFKPGSSVFSVGFVGCNLRCPFCQNWEISQGTNAASRRIDPIELIALAVSSGAGSIAYTYSEPLVHIEYVIESMNLARKAGLANVLVTNGCVREDAALAALALCDATNVDLKAYRAETYAKILGGDLETVKRFIEIASGLGVHIEATTLVVTRMNDSEDEIRKCVEFLSGVSPDLPYHLSAYHPDYNFREAATDGYSLIGLAASARKRLNYVYVGNIAGESNDTRCPVCGKIAVRRKGYRVDTAGLIRDSSGTARCAECDAPLPFRF